MRRDGRGEGGMGGRGGVGGERRASAHVHVVHVCVCAVDMLGQCMKCMYVCTYILTYVHAYICVWQCVCISQSWAVHVACTCLYCYIT